MNRFEKLLGKKRQAEVEYLDGEYNVLFPGEFVICALSGVEIPLDQLKYWSVVHQQAYASADLALKAEKQQRGIEP